MIVIVRLIFLFFFFFISFNSFSLNWTERIGLTLNVIEQSQKPQLIYEVKQKSKNHIKCLMTCIRGALNYLLSCSSSIVNLCTHTFIYKCIGLNRIIFVFLVSPTLSQIRIWNVLDLFFVLPFLFTSILHFVDFCNVASLSSLSSSSLFGLCTWNGIR